MYSVLQVNMNELAEFFDQFLSKTEAYIFLLSDAFRSRKQRFWFTNNTRICTNQYMLVHYMATSSWVILDPTRKGNRHILAKCFDTTCISCYLFKRFSPQTWQ